MLAMPSTMVRKTTGAITILHQVHEGVADRLHRRPTPARATPSRTPQRDGDEDLDGKILMKSAHDHQGWPEETSESSLPTWRAVTRPPYVESKHQHGFHVSCRRASPGRRKAERRSGRKTRPPCAPSDSTNRRVASAVPPVARTSSTINTRAGGAHASAWISSVSVPYSRSYVSRRVTLGSFPGFLTGMKPAPSVARSDRRG